MTNNNAKTETGFPTFTKHAKEMITMGNPPSGRALNTYKLESWKCKLSFFRAYNCMIFARETLS